MFGFLVSIFWIITFLQYQVRALMQYLDRALQKVPVRRKLLRRSEWWHLSNSQNHFRWPENLRLAILSFARALVWKLDFFVIFELFTCGITQDTKNSEGTLKDNNLITLLELELEGTEKKKISFKIPRVSTRKRIPNEKLRN